MSIDTRFSGLLGAWPPSGGLALPPDLPPGGLTGLLATPQGPQPAMGVLAGPGDPSNLGPPFDPTQAMASGQDAALVSPLNGSNWLAALQTLHASLQTPSAAVPSEANSADVPGSTSAGTADPLARDPVQSPLAPVSSVVAAPTVDGGALLSFDPSGLVTHFKPSGLAQAAGPSAHAGDYATRDEAAEAGRADIPKDSADEYVTWIGKHQVPVMFPDIGKGPTPFMLDRFSYPGLSTSNNPDKADLAIPPGAVAWLHNHPYDPVNLGDINNLNRNPSPADNEGSHGDWYWAHLMQQKTPDFSTYIVGPDGVLRRFQNSDRDGVELK